MKARVERAGASTYRWVIESERTDMDSLSVVLETMAIELLSWTQLGGEIVLAAPLKFSDLAAVEANWRAKRSKEDKSDGK